MSDKEPKSSLLLDNRQPELLPSADFFKQQLEPRLQELEEAGESSGERLWERNPDKYKAIVVLLAQKIGVITIGKILGISPNTVLAVRDREGISVDMVKAHLSTIAHAGATLASEGILEVLNQVLQRKHALGVKDLKDLAVVYGILVQNGQLLAGQPTARVEVTEITRPEHDDSNAFIRGLKPIEVQTTHLDEKISGQKEGPNAGANGADGQAVEPADAPGGTGAVLMNSQTETPTNQRENSK